MRSVVAIAAVVLMTAAYTGSAIAATASAIHHQVQTMDGKKGDTHGKTHKN